MKIKNILKTCALTLTAFLGVCSLASCKIDNETNENGKNEQTEQVAEGVHGSKVELEIVLKVGDNESTSYTCEVTRDKNKTNISNYLTTAMTNEIRDFYGIKLKEDKLYQLVGGKFDKIEAKFDNMVLIEKIGVWSDCEYNELTFAKETIKAFETDIVCLENSEEELCYFNEDKATGKMINDLFKQYVVNEGKNLGDFTDFNASWDKNTNKITGNISASEVYTTSTTITYDNLSKMLYDLIEYDTVFAAENVGGYGDVKCNFKVVNAGERGLLSRFIIETTIGNKTYNYNFLNNLHTKLEITITDNATNTENTYIVWFM